MNRKKSSFGPRCPAGLDAALMQPYYHSLIFACAEEVCCEALRIENRDYLETNSGHKLKQKYKEYVGILMNTCLYFVVKRRCLIRNSWNARAGN